MFQRIYTFLFYIIAFAPMVAFGQLSQKYVPLAGLPGVTDRSDPTLIGYLNAIFMLSISIAAMVAVVRISVAGFQYMISTDGWANREEAKGTILAVLIGLAVLLASYIILYTINPDLVTLNILQQK